MSPMDNLRKIRADLDGLVQNEFARIEKSEYKFLEEFISFMESPLDDTSIIHTGGPRDFLELYNEYVKEYDNKKKKAEEAKKNDISILNYSKKGSKDDLLNIGVHNSY